MEISRFPARLIFPSEKQRATARQLNIDFNAAPRCKPYLGGETPVRVAITDVAEVPILQFTRIVLHESAVGDLVLTAAQLTQHLIGRQMLDAAAPRYVVLEAYAGFLQSRRARV